MKLNDDLLWLIISNICDGYGTYGGGVYIEPNSSIAVIENSQIITNSSWRGGAIYQEAGSLIIRNVKLIENLADQKGGGIGVDNATTYIYESVISKNSTSDGSGQGSGIHSRYSSLICNNTIIEGNNGWNGAGMNIHWGSMDASNIIVKDNISSYKGGGIFLEHAQVGINNIIHLIRVRVIVSFCNRFCLWFVHLYSIQ